MKTLLTTNEYAKQYNIHPRTVYKKIKNGTLESLKIDKITYILVQKQGQNIGQNEVLQSPILREKVGQNVGQSVGQNVGQSKKWYLDTNFRRLSIIFTIIASLSASIYLYLQHQILTSNISNITPKYNYQKLLINKIKHQKIPQATIDAYFKKNFSYIEADEQNISKYFILCNKNYTKK